MSGKRQPGSTGGGAEVESIDAGTSARIGMPAPPSAGATDRERFESATRTLEAEVANVGAHLTIDGAARDAYVRQTKLMADNLRAEAAIGRISWSQAAAQAQDARNAMMLVVRDHTTAVGRAFAQQLKGEGRTLNELIARKALQLHGPAADFTQLSSRQQNAVFAEIVTAAGRSNPRVTAAVRGLSRAGRGLLVLSVGLSVYSIATADDWADAAEREVAVNGAGIGGGIAGGALAGLACGPGAPVCVTVGAFVGGALAAFGADSTW